LDGPCHNECYRYGLNHRVPSGMGELTHKTIKMVSSKPHIPDSILEFMKGIMPE